MKAIGSFCLILISLIAFQNCSSTNQSVSGDPAALAAFYFGQMTSLKVAVYYEPGSEPYVGTGAGGRPYWGVLEENLEALFRYRTQAPAISVPKSLAEMTPLPDQANTTWTAQQILQLHNLDSTDSGVSGESTFFIYFLDGYYSSGTGPESQVIGVNLTGTPIIAIFKDVVKASGANPNGAVPKFVEQSTLVHEMGHALGLVNIGIPLTSAHQDVNHGAHTNNSNCVMYWANEGLADLQQFVLKYVASQNVEMWGPEVLADVEAISK